MILQIPLILLCFYSWNYEKSINYLHKHFQTFNIFQIKVAVQYFWNLLIKKKLLTSYLLSTLKRLLAQIVYLIDHYFFWKGSRQILFDLSFMTGVFPWVLITTEVSHALINITENIRKALDDGNIGCGVFVDL